jgi:hypothetical protein
MATPDTPELVSSTPSEPVSFVTSWKEAETQSDATYNEFFQETSDGNIAIGKKAQKSGLEITVTVLGYILPVAILLVAVGSFHVFIQKWGGAQSIKENYTFLCPYLNYAVDLPDGDTEHSCDTMTAIYTAYSEKKSGLESEIIDKLNEYIPVKLTKNILLTSPERKFAETTFQKKLHMDLVIEKFEEVRSSAKSLQGNNIVCNGISINSAGDITTQCTVYGSASWNDDENGRLWSARIEALRFLAVLADTAKSQFILLNPPTALSMEKITDNRDFSNFETRTTVSIQAKYVPFNSVK